jgi:hypothetical protein
MSSPYSDVGAHTYIRNSLSTCLITVALPEAKRQITIGKVFDVINDDGDQGETT